MELLSFFTEIQYTVILTVFGAVVAIGASLHLGLSAWINAKWNLEGTLVLAFKSGFFGLMLLFALDILYSVIAVIPIVW